MSHVHEHWCHLKVTLFPSGRKMEHCKCGASRETDAHGVVQSWHTCELCTHAFGLEGIGQEGVEPSTCAL